MPTKEARKKAYAKSYYEANKERLLAAQRARWADGKIVRNPADRMRCVKNHIAKKSQFVRDLKSVPCADCGGEFPPCAMDFHHVSGEKDFGIATLRTAAFSRIKLEADKCVVLCANCHRIRHFSEKK